MMNESDRHFVIGAHNSLGKVGAVALVVGSGAGYWAGDKWQAYEINDIGAMGVTNFAATDGFGEFNWLFFLIVASPFFAVALLAFAVFFFVPSFLVPPPESATEPAPEHSDDSSSD